MKKKFERHLECLETKLSHIQLMLEEDPIQHTPIAISLTMESLLALRTIFLNLPLSTQDEIVFFKYCKPQLTSKLIYFNERLKIELNKPQASQKTVKKYYSEQLKKLEQFTHENAAFLKYYSNDHQYLDHCYFVRNKEDYKLDMDSYTFQYDKAFSTSHDYKVAQILANAQLQKYLWSKLQKFNKTKNQCESKILKWTGF